MTRKILNTVLTVGAVVAGISVATSAQANDNYCRDFNQKIKINGQFEKAYGRACLQPNGTWKIIPVNDDHDHYDDDHHTTHYTIKKTYTHASPYRVALYWGNGHHYHGYGKHYKRRYRHYKKHHYYHRHGKHHGKYHYHGKHKKHH